MKTFSITDAGAIREMNQDFYFSSDTAVGNLPEWEDTKPVTMLPDTL